MKYHIYKKVILQRIIHFPLRRKGSKPWSNERLYPPPLREVVKIKDGSDGERKEDNALDANITIRCHAVDKETEERIIIAITLTRLERFHPADFCSGNFSRSLLFSIVDRNLGRTSNTIRDNLGPISILAPV